MQPIAYVHTLRLTPEDDFWGGVDATITLTDGADPDALLGIESFSHAEVLFVFDRVLPSSVIHGARRPRNNPAWPLVGILAQRAKGRPNRLGSTIVRIRGREGSSLLVSELDAIDGTPVLDIKPVMREFLPREPVVQPRWADELMSSYWSTPGDETPRLEKRISMLCPGDGPARTTTPEERADVRPDPRPPSRRPE